MEHTVTNKKNLWFVMSCQKIGGAERRMLNLAMQILDIRSDIRIKFLITKQLYTEYQQDHQLSNLIKKTQEIEFHFAEQPKKIVKPSGGLFKRWIYGIQYKIPFLNRRNQYLDIIHFSWFEELLKLTLPEDYIHCFTGEIERNTGVLLAFLRNRKVVLEITSNRHITKIVSDLKFLLQKKVICPTLKINCISKTVFENFILCCGNSFLEEKKISCTHYKTPCLPIQYSSSHQEKQEYRQNHIIFGHRFSIPKNGLLFAKVISEMYQKGELDNWKVYFYGRGIQEKEIRTELSQVIENQVAKVDWSNNLESDLQKSKIFISLIETGSYPSQSVFQAMQNGNILILGDTGETRHHFSHNEIFFTEINQSKIRNNLLLAMSEASNKQIFATKSTAMIRFFEVFKRQSNQASEFLLIHLL